MAEDIGYQAGTDVGLGVDSPSGVNVVNPGGGINLPMASVTGATANTAQSSLAGTDQNSPKGPAKWRWEVYSFLLNSYYGSGGFKDGSALTKQQNEYNDQYLERRSTVSYRNYFKPIVDAQYLPVFSMGATRKTEVNGTLDENGKLAPLWNAFTGNTDNRNRHIRDFTKKIIKNSRMLGVAFVCMDNFNDIPTLQQDALKLRKFPYAYMRLPMQVEGELVELDDFCKIQKIAFKEQPEKVMDPISKRMVEEPRWKLWTKDYSVKLRKDIKTNTYEELSETRVVYNLGEVPVIPVMSQSETTDDTILPLPPLYCVADTNLSIFNLDSLIMRMVRSQLFPILCMPTPQMSDPNDKLSVSPLQGIYLPPNTSEGSYPLPMFLTPPSGPVDFLLNLSEKYKEALFEMAGQNGVVGVQKAQSGIAKAFDFQGEAWVLKESAKMASKLEEEMARIFKLYVPSEVFDYECHYEEDYNQTDPMTDVQLYQSYINMQPGQLGEGLAKEMMTRSMFDDLDDETVQPVIDQIREEAKKPKPESLQPIIPNAQPVVGAVNPEQENPQPVVPPKKAIKQPVAKKFSIKKMFTGAK
jgi:hypothetical protein